MTTAPDWRQAACTRINVDPELFHTDGKNEDRSRRRQAIAICTECPIRIDCLQYGLDHPELDGIYGGVTARQRHDIRKKMRAA